MSSTAKPFVMPAKDPAEKRVVFRRDRDGFRLTDARRIDVWVSLPLTITCGAGAGTLFYMGFMRLVYPPGSSATRDLATMEAILFIVGGCMPLALLGLLLAGLKIHRRFAVSVDTDLRICRCDRRWFGLPMGSREADAREIEWTLHDGIAKQVTRQNFNAGRAILIVLLVLLGPLGLIIGLFLPDRSGPRSVMVLHLVMEVNGEPIAVVTLAEEDAAMAFLEAWDTLMV